MGKRIKKFKLKWRISDKKDDLKSIDKNISYLYGADNLFGVRNFNQKLKNYEKRKSKIKRDISNLKKKLKKVV